MHRVHILFNSLSPNRRPCFGPTYKLLTLHVPKVRTITVRQRRNWYFQLQFNSLSGQFTNLLAGTYIVTATDANGCTLTTSVTLRPACLDLDQHYSHQPNLCPRLNRLINVSANGGTGTIIAALILR